MARGIFVVASTALLATLAGGAAAFAAEFVVGPKDAVQAALDLAADDDVVRVKGVHEESIVISKRISLVGEGATLQGVGRGTTVLATLEAGAAGSTVSGFNFRFAEDGSNAVVVRSGADGVSFRDCRFKAVDGTAVVLEGVSGTVFEDCRFTGNDADILASSTGFSAAGSVHRRWRDVAVEAHDTVSLSDCTFTLGLGLALDLQRPVEDSLVLLDSKGVASVAPAGSLLQFCTVSRSGEGIRAQDADFLALSFVAVQGVRENALVLDGAGIRVEDCSVRVDRGEGIRVEGDDALLTRNRISGAVLGILVRGAAPSVTGNTVSRCEAGIVVDGFSTDSGATVSGNTVAEISGPGIMVGGCEGPDVSSNTLRGVSGYDFETGAPSGALSLYGCPDAVVDGNTVGDVDGGFGVLLEDCASFDVSYNTVRGTMLSGIVAVPGYSYYPLVLRTSLLPPVPEYYAAIEWNTVSDCGDSDGAGIALGGMDSVSVAGNLVLSSGGVGILLVNSTGCEVDGNDVRSTERDGIWLLGNGKTPHAVTGNVIASAGAEGIQSSTCSPTVIARNIVKSSVFLPLANEGSVDEDASTGNVNGKSVSIDPPDWDAVLPRERAGWGVKCTD